MLPARSPRRVALCDLMLVVAALSFGNVSAALTVDESIAIFDAAAVSFNAKSPESGDRDGTTFRDYGRVLERKVTLPAMWQDQRDARRIVAVVQVNPVVVEEDGRPRIADPWTRLGHVSIILPSETADESSIVELMRFTTGFGGVTTFEQDVTAYAPILNGETTFRASISTWFEPAWSITLRLEFREESPGYRRPKLVLPFVGEARFTADNNARSMTVRIGEGLALPRLHILSTGHGGGQEFVTSTHILRIDGQEIARWRPWREDGGGWHAVNPASGRWEIDGRVLWSSDIDRSGWMPGSMVDPLRIPLPELTPGEHTVELVIENILAPEGEGEADGYWIVSAAIVADEPWPAAADEGADQPPNSSPPPGDSNS